MEAAWTESVSVLLPGILQCLMAAGVSRTRLPLTAVLAYEAGLLLLLLAGGTLGSAALALQIVLLCAVMQYIAKAPGLTAAASAILAVTLTWLSFGIVSSLISLFVPSMPEPLPLWPGIASAVAGCLLNLVLCVAVLRRQLRGPYSVKLALFMLSPVLCVLAVEELMARSLYSTVTTDAPLQLHLWALGAQLAGLAAVFWTLAAYRRLMRALEAERRLQYFADARDAQQRHIEALQQKLCETRRLRHDWRNHLSVLRGLLEKGEYKRARAYLEELGAVAAETDPPQSCGRPAVDILLAEKQAEAAAAGITMEIDPFELPERVPDDLDLCIIFANALDNAIAACKEAPGEKRIEVHCQRVQNLMSVQFINSCAPGIQPQPGIGLGNIQCAAQKYYGDCLLRIEDGKAVLVVLLVSSERFCNHS